MAAATTEHEDEVTALSGLLNMDETMSGNIPGKDMNGVEKGMEFSREAWEKELSKFYVCRSDMNKLIMNYLITEGFREAAEKFQVEGGIKAPVLSGSMDDRIRVRDSIQNGYLQEARELLNQLHPELLDDNRLLRFHLLQQELIELIRKGSVEDALAFAQKHLAETGEEDPSVLPELERTLALLAFDQPGTSPFADLLHPAHRQKVASEVNAAILKHEYQENVTSKLSVICKLILWAQDELDKKKVKYWKMTELSTGQLEDSKS